MAKSLWRNDNQSMKALLSIKTCIALSSLTIATAFASEREQINEYRETTSKLWINHKAQVELDHKIYATRAEVRNLTKTKSAKTNKKVEAMRAEIEKLTTSRRQLADDETELRVKLATIDGQCPSCARDAANESPSTSSAEGLRIPASSTTTSDPKPSED